MTAVRKRLPNRRPSHTETLEVAGQAVTATVGFDPADDQPRELFLSAGKEGSTLDALLADAAVAISVALQHGVTAQALAKSVGRLPGGPRAMSSKSAGPSFARAGRAAKWAASASTVSSSRSSACGAICSEPRSPSRNRISWSIAARE